MTTTTQRLKPTQSSSILSSSDHRPAVVLCSSKDNHLLSQDICTLCGSVGKSNEGNLIACSQCGQCYHPFCVNIKGLKVVISKGWRCLECTVCETCGQPGDEAKLLLCDECELSCHTYCLNPPLEEVPQGAWKCHWCVVCQKCGSHSPGLNSDWQKNYTECGPCSSQRTCPKCKDDYSEDDLIIQCINCSRWLHAQCDSIRDEEECELAIELGYTCLMCRPADEVPLYIVHRKSIDNTFQSQSDVASLDAGKVPSMNMDYMKHHDSSSLFRNIALNNIDIDQPFLPSVNNLIQPTNCMSNSSPRPQSAPLTPSYESKSTTQIKRPSSSLHFNCLDKDSAKNEEFDQNTPNRSPIRLEEDLMQNYHMVDGVYLSETGINFMKNQKLEPAKRQRAKRGARLQKSDDCLDDNRDDDEENKCDDKADEDGRKKRVRKLSRVGIGGFAVRQRGVRINKDDDFNYSQSNDFAEASTPPSIQVSQNPQAPQDRITETSSNSVVTKPKRIRKRAKKTNLIDQYPAYLQEAFFGKELLSIEISTRQQLSAPSPVSIKQNQMLMSPLSQQAIDYHPQTQQQQPINSPLQQPPQQQQPMSQSPKAQIQHLHNRAPQPLSIQSPKPPIHHQVPQSPTPQQQQQHQVISHQQPQCRSPLSSHIQQPPQHQAVNQSITQQQPTTIHHNSNQANNRIEPEDAAHLIETGDDLKDLGADFNILDYLETPATPTLVQQPDPSRQHNASQISDHNWQQVPVRDIDAISQNKKNAPAQDWESDEALGVRATKSAVLYANMEHPNLRQEYRTPEERHKQIQKLWRQLPAERRKYFVEKARENRSASKVSNKPVNEVASGLKTTTPRMQPKPYISAEVSPMQSHVQISQNSMLHQDTRWKQPIPPEIQSQGTRFLPSPQSHRPNPHIGHDQNIVCPPPEVMSPSLRTLVDHGTHYEHSPQPMISPQTPSPSPQFSRPTPPLHSIQVSRVRPPSIDSARAPNVDPYSMPPSTPRPMPIQQRSPFSPQSPYPTITGISSSTSPINPRQTLEQPSLYQSNQNMVGSQNQSPVQSGFIEPQYQPQQSQFQPRQPQYNPAQVRAIHHPQYNNNMPNPAPTIRTPMNPQMRSQLPTQQQTAYPQYRQQHTSRFPNQHQDIQHHTGSPIQQNSSPQHMHQQRIHSPVISRQIPHSGQHQQTRVSNQPRMQMTQGQIMNAIPHQNQMPHSPMPQQQSPMHQPPQHHHSPISHPIQQIAAPQPMIQQQQPHAIHYTNPLIGSRVDTDDVPTILDDEDDLKDLGADFNILEYADPEPDKGASTSSGKNNIELDADLEMDYFDDRETVEEKRTAPIDHVPLNSQQSIHHPGQQVVYSQAHPQQQPVVQHNHNFVDGQHQGVQHTMVTPNQYSPQRHMSYVNQRPSAPNNSHQYAPNQQQMIRPQQNCTNMRMQHPHPQQVSYQHRPQAQRYHGPSTMNSEHHQQQSYQQVQPQTIVNQQVNQVPNVRMSQIHSNQQYQQSPQQQQQQPNFIEGQQSQISTVQQYPQQAQQPIIYNSHQTHHTQVNARRHFQADQQQQHYQYQQPNHMSYQMAPNMQQHHLMKQNNDPNFQDKTPIVGETITSMEFTMYDQGSGMNNEAVNLPAPTHEVTNVQNQSDELPNEAGPIPESSQHEQMRHCGPSDPNSEQITTVANNMIETVSRSGSNLKSSVDTTLIAAPKLDLPFKFHHNTSANASGRISAGSNTQETDNSHRSTTNHPTTSEKGGSSQPQNQLLKQLLGNCSSADSPSQESPSLLHEPISKVSIQPSNHIMSKQVGYGIPNISFQMDTNSKVIAPITPNPAGNQNITMQPPIKGPTIIGSTSQVQQQTQVVNSTVMPTPNFDIKSYSVAQPSHPNVNLAPVVRVQQLPNQINTNPIVHKRPDALVIASESQQHLRPQTINQPSRLIDQKNQNGSFDASDNTLACSSAQVQSRTNDETVQPTRVTAKTTASKAKKDYMAERRAALEREKTPPPREVKPKKRARGPNKRTRFQDEDSRVDSNSNTSETSQLQEQPRKRARKSLIKTSKVDQENSESLLSSIAVKIHAELPKLAVREPQVQIRNDVGSIFGCGDLNLHKSRLRGSFGRTILASDVVKPCYSKNKRRHVGFYHEEFPKDLDVILFESQNKLIPDFNDRDCTSPGSIISGSSSDSEDGNDLRENKSDSKFKTLDIIRISSRGDHHPRRHNELNDINNNNRSISPSIPISIRLPVTSMSPSVLSEFGSDVDDNNKENLQESTELDNSIDNQNEQNTGTSLNMRLREHGNVSVTLTLTNKEVDGVKRVLSSLSQLIDYPIQPPCVIHNAKSTLDQQDVKPTLSESFRLVAEGQSGTSSMCAHKNLMFDEHSYVPYQQGNPIKSIEEAKYNEIIDIKPEICCRCKAIIVDRGIKKNIGELPENTIAMMKKASIVGEEPRCELIFCSVQCYAASIMLSQSSLAKLAATSKKSGYAVKTPPGLPPMSPMMEDDEDDIIAANKLHDKEKKETCKSPFIGLCSDSNRKRQWRGIRYTRWKPSYFDLNKSTSPLGTDEPRIPSSAETNLQNASQLMNQGDSSIDSNESDNSTTCSQSTSGKLINNLDDANYDQCSDENHQLTADNRFRSSRDISACKDILTPWPEGLNMIQVKPIKSALKIKSEIDQASVLHISTDEQMANFDEMYEDTRKCVLCHEYGDGESDGPARLLNLFIDGWVHLNCALWSLDVYELANGALMNVELACKKAMTCSFCYKPGATLKCFKPRCPNYYHFLCATRERCSFYEDKSLQCRQHSKSAVKEMTSFIVKRRVYINRDEQKQIAEMIQGEQQNVMRIGSLIFLNIGQLLPHQLASFHSQFNIFPVSYKVIRYYWSYRQFNRRCKYVCSIEDNEGRPQFRIIAQEHGYTDDVFLGETPHSVWKPIIDMIVDLRKSVPDTITTFPAYIRGEDLFGLTEPSIVRILESLPGVENLTDYEFKFGRSPLLELPLAINPSGCARTEPRTHFKRPFTIQTASSVPKSRLQSLSSGDSSSPYIKQFVHSKSSQYRKMKSEWRNNVVLARSRVQGLGLYAARDIEKHTMVIEYIGMLIRNEIAERYERIHEQNNRGIYMFRLDEDRVIDATLAGGLARYINHSCNPNCVAEAVEIDRERKILIIANRKILKGEELGYDYKLAIEDDQHKISCLCGAPTCKKWMN